ncbi:TonB-dependent receptor [Chryseobacterium lactis]|uniref:TonB-dependent receptor n=2 Tax=Chryseobacterium lactis TaxID=1241981 RepID=A0A3G6RRK1_CHRLC|nr:outer membrane beta-barrel family protein [Chryseobacterium lactis]AZA84276.1 TonB-dependent receptor [Chryseobacterium lactis]AZB04664.1 TonB-dependent receptor [Chryseobacterium lactis]PNW14395.1 TonB-dependent receptor [Chryseobacterium lactis]
MRCRVPRLILLVIFFCFGAVSQAQSITGNVLNAGHKKLSDVEVIAMSEANEKFSSITDINGQFQIKVPKEGNYTIQIIQNGEQLISEKTLINSDLHKDFKIEAVQNIEGVVIKSEKRLIDRKIDRLVFNVEKSVSAQGGDILDTLRVIPGVQVKNDEISIIGKSGVSVLLDDRIVQLSGNDLVNYLKSISSDDVKSIEIITTPPAKYDAQGNSGLINIKYKTGKNNNWNASIRGSYTQKTYALGAVGGNFLYKKNKLAVSSNFSYSEGAQKNIDQNVMGFSSETWVGYQPRKVTYDPSLGFRVGADYDISNKISLGAIFLTQVSNMKINNRNNVISVFDNSMLNKQYDIITNAQSNSKSPANSLNFHALYKIDSVGTKLSLDVDYFNYKEKSDYRFTSGNFYNDVEDISTQQNGSNYGKLNLNNTSVKSDLEIPMKGLKLSMGAKISFSNTTNDLSLFNLNLGETDPGYRQVNNFDYKENTQAGYVSAEKAIDKWTFQLGLRAENTNIKGSNSNETFTRDYIKFFPTAYVLYAVNKNSSLSANYSKRINRPSFEFLNPFRTVTNQYTYIEGNPFLQPSYTDNVEANYTYKNWANKIYYTRLSDGFQQLPVIDPVTNIQIVRPENYFETNTFGINESYTFKAFSWIETVASADAFYSDSKSLVNFTNPSLAGWNLGFSVYNTLNLNKSKTLQAGLNYEYSLPGVQDIYKSTSRSNMSISFAYSLLNNNLRLGLVANDLFDGQRTTYSAYSNGVKISFKNYYDTRNFRISITYKFGNKKVSVEQKDFGNEDEKARASS